MSAFLNLLAKPLKFFGQHRPEKNPAAPRILVIRRNRMGDMIYTLPLLHTLRWHYPNAHLVVACDPVGAEIARACDAVNEVVILNKGGLPGLGLLHNAARLQGYDWVVAAKGGFDRRLAALSRLTNGAVRIGFVPQMDKPSGYTDPVALPENPYDEHQIETLLRLLKPLGIATDENAAIDLSITVPKSSLEFAAPLLALPVFHRFMLVNLSSTVPLKFREEDFIALTAEVLASTDLSVCFVAAPADQSKAAALGAKMTSGRVTSVATPGPLDLAALLQKSVGLFTPEGGAAHLAAAVGTPAVVLWSEGPFKKWHSRAPNHIFIHAENNESTVPLERVWQALKTMLSTSTR